MPGRGHPPEVT